MSQLNLISLSVENTWSMMTRATDYCSTKWYL